MATAITMSEFTREARAEQIAAASPQARLAINVARLATTAYREDAVDAYEIAQILTDAATKVLMITEDCPRRVAMEVVSDAFALSSDRCEDNQRRRGQDDNEEDF